MPARAERIGIWAFLVLSGCQAQPSDPLVSRSDAGGSADANVSPARPPSCADTDRDQDGYGTDPSCPILDCDDTNVAIHPGAPEACNGVDDNCDGQIDEDLGFGTCGTGTCRRTAPNCVDGRPGACTPSPGTEETCNGIDDDCDGMTDEGVTGAVCGAGACARTAACVSGAMEACVPGAPGPETCNRIDDNCDGSTDEGFRARVANDTYSVLVGFHGDCNGSSERLGPNCNAAMHRYCASDGCSTSGFGPLENSGDFVAVGCVAADGDREVPYATLAAHQSFCDGSRERMGPSCNEAMHLYCRSLSYESGFGPVESGPDFAVVTCVGRGAATALVTTYTELAMRHPGCDGATAGSRYGSDCNAAIHRFCSATGFSTGFGPVGSSGDQATVTCVSP